MSTLRNYFCQLFRFTFILVLQGQGSFASENIVTGAPQSLLSDGEREGIFRITQGLLSEFDRKESVYILLGRSPTPLYAALTLANERIGGIKAVNLPLSDIPNIIPYLNYGYYDDGFDTDYLQKLFRHFDVYLDDVLAELSSSHSSRKLILVDYVRTGNSLGQAKRILDFYLRYKSQTNPSLSSIIGIKTEYFGYYAHEENIDPTSLKRSIDGYQVPFRAEQSGEIVVRQVAPGDVEGRVTKYIEVDQLVTQINQRTAKPQWHWSGKLFDIKGFSTASLIEKFEGQWFDAYGVYGEWLIDRSPLNLSKDIRSEYSQLFESLRMCHSP